MGNFWGSDERTVMIAGRVLAVTARAILVRTLDGVENWLPKSQVRSGDEDAEVGDEGEWEIPVGLAAEKEFI